MSLGLVGRKIGMTRFFTEDGVAVPVTVVDVSNNRVTQIKTQQTDGYAALQVTYGVRRAVASRSHKLATSLSSGGSRRCGARIQSRRCNISSYSLGKHRCGYFSSRAKVDVSA